MIIKKKWNISRFVFVGIVVCLAVGYFYKNTNFTSREIINSDSDTSSLTGEDKNIVKSPSQFKDTVSLELVELNSDDVSGLIDEKEPIPKSPSNKFTSSGNDFVDMPDDVALSITVDFICRDPCDFGQYSYLLNNAQRLGSEDSITEVLDFGIVILDEVMVQDMSYDDVLFVLKFCEKMSGDLKMFEGTVSPEFMQIAHARIILTEYGLPRERSALLDLEIAQDEFHKLRNISLDDPLLERQRRYLMFMAQTEGLYRNPDKDCKACGGYYNYDILREVLKFPQITSDCSVREQIAIAKINIAANLEYARRNFISNSKDTQGDFDMADNEKILEHYNKAINQYEEVLTTSLDSLVKDFADNLNAGDKRYIAMLKQRLVKDQRRVPWHYKYY